jgi:hypothetical protein
MSRIVFVLIILALAVLFLSPCSSIGFGPYDKEEMDRLAERSKEGSLRYSDLIRKAP